jgi:hypothetical protein
MRSRVIESRGYHGVSTIHAEKPVEKPLESSLEQASQAALHTLTNALCNPLKPQRTLELGHSGIFGKKAREQSVKRFPQPPV